MTAAIFAAGEGAQVVLLEHKDRVGKKICLPAMDAVTFQTVCRSRSATAVVSRIFHGRRLGRLRFR